MTPGHLSPATGTLKVRTLEGRAVGATNEDLARWGAELGHSRARVIPAKRPDMFRGQCGCGYTSTNRRTEALAVDALIHHLYKVIRDARAAGWVPAAPRDTPSSAKVPRSVGARL